MEPPRRLSSWRPSHTQQPVSGLTGTLGASHQSVVAAAGGRRSSVLILLLVMTIVLLVMLVQTLKDETVSDPSLPRPAAAAIGVTDDTVIAEQLENTSSSTFLTNEASGNAVARRREGVTYPLLFSPVEPPFGYDNVRTVAASLCSRDEEERDDEVTRRNKQQRESSPRNELQDDVGYDTHRSLVPCLRHITSMAFDRSEHFITKFSSNRVTSSGKLSSKTAARVRDWQALPSKAPFSAVAFSLHLDAGGGGGGEEKQDHHNNEENVYLVILLRHHYTSASHAQRVHDNTHPYNETEWKHYITEVVGPNELLGAVTIRRSSSNGRGGDAVMMPLGCLYVGYNRRDRWDEYITVVSIPKTLSLLSNNKYHNNGADPSAPSHSSQVNVDLTFVHEYDEYWAINEEQLTALRNVHRIILDHRFVLMSAAAAAAPRRERRRLLPPPAAMCRGYPEERALYIVREGETQQHQQQQQKLMVARYAPIRGADRFVMVGAQCSYQHVSVTNRGVEAAPSSADGSQLLQQVAQYVRREEETAAAAAAATPLLRILFIGDSQIRSLYRHWVSVLDDTPVLLHKIFNETHVHYLSKGTTTRRGGVPVATTTFHWDAYLRRLASSTPAEAERLVTQFDVVIAGFGSWPASYGQYSIGSVTSRLQSLANVVATMASLRRRRRDADNERSTTIPRIRRIRLPTFIYAGSPAWPKHRKNNPGFRITNTRLHVYNRLAVQLLSRSVDALHGVSWTDQVRFLPLFDLSVTMSRMKRSDGMHYDGSIVMFSAVDALATILFS